ncbi:sulfatase family protein [Pontiella agarivorans]|uniref:Sulfatase n=1 Tax=Pontiella agarivorans TaxID=3038953 RepID=A0ABU5MS73_9BACT|nr:sulfatase [Pontiella agarivorans]MDZ8117022.1 sulfatase [Pontiella agarivorans]
MRSSVLCILLFVGLSVAARPNVIIILADDQGYNDLGCYGSKTIKTPRIDQMAREGIRLTDYYAAAPLCGPSRAALLTGCYAQRLAEYGKEKECHTVIDSGEVLISELLQSAGYKTACIGKWHVAGSKKTCIKTAKNGSGLERYSMARPEIMPMQKGFDVYFGTPYSNDMDPTVLIRGNEIVEELGHGEKQAGLSTRYTDEALSFIESNKDAPFFLYLAFNMPHKPLWPGKEFEGKSAYGRYGDCIEEIDWNTGRVLDKLTELGIDENTFVVYMSDNGPFKAHKAGIPKFLKRVPDASYIQGGCADPLKGHKLTSNEGGLRVPAIIRWPKGISAGRVSSELVSAIDLFPTIVRLAGATLPDDRVIDGVDLTEFLTGKRVQSGRDHFYYYKWLYLYAVRDSEWKLVMPRPAVYKDMAWYCRGQEAVKEPTLYNLKKDIGETVNVAAQHPEVVSRLMKVVEQAREDLGDRATGLDGSGIRHNHN